MEKITLLIWIASVLQIFAFTAPILIILRVGYSLAPFSEETIGISRPFAAISIIVLSKLFNTWLFMGYEQISPPLRTLTEIADITGLLITISSGIRLLNIIRSRGEVAKPHLSLNILVALLGGAFSSVLITFLFKAIYHPGVYILIDPLLYNLEIGLLGGIYICFGISLQKISKQTGRLQTSIPFFASLFIFNDAILRSAFYYSNFSFEEITRSRLLSSSGMAVGGIMLIASIASPLGRLIQRLTQDLIETSLVQRKRGVQKRFLIGFTSTIIVTCAAGFLILENINSGEKAVESTFLSEQVKVARAIASNLEELTNDLFFTLDSLASKPAIQNVRRPDIQRIVKPVIIKWNSIVLAFSRVDESGHLLYTYPEVKNVFGTDLRYQRHVQRFLNEKTYLVSRPFQAVQGYEAIAIYSPVFKSNGKDRRLFKGGVAFLIRTTAFSARAFRNAALLNPNPFAAIDEDGYIIAESRNLTAPLTVNDYIESVFTNSIKPPTLDSVVKKVINSNNTQILPLPDDKRRFPSRKLISVPITLAGKHWGHLLMPITSEQVISIFHVATSQQTQLWLLLLILIVAAVGTLGIVFQRWARYLEKEVYRESEIVRLTEAKYTKLVDNALVGIFEATPDGTLVSANPSFMKMLGCESLQDLKDLLNENNLKISPGDINNDGDALISRLDNIKSTFRKDGKQIYVRIQANAVKGNNGEILRWEGFIEDITNQYIATKKISDSERKYAELFALSPAGIYVTTPEGDILEVNDSFARIMGFDSAEEIKRVHPEELYETNKGRDEFLSELRKDGALTNHITIGKKRDGSSLYLLENAQIGYDPQYGREIIRGVVMDFTPIVKLQKEIELRKRTADAVNEILLSAFEENTVSKFVLRSLKSLGEKLELDYVILTETSDNTSLKVTSKWIRGEFIPDDIDIPLLRVPPAELELALDTFFKKDGNIYTADSSELPHGFNEFMSPLAVSSIAVAILRSSERTIGYLLFCAASGLSESVAKKENWSQFDIELIHSASQIFSAVLERFAQSEARLKLEEEKQRLLLAFDQLVESVVVTDPNGIIEYVNRGFSMITGYTAQEVLGKTPRILKSGKMSDEFYKNLWKTITDGRAFRGRFVNQKRDGTHYIEDKTIAPVIDAEGKISHYIAVGYDATAQVSLEEQLTQAQKLESIGLLAGGIAHDFNNIIGAILGYASFMKSKIPPDDKFYKYLDTIERSATRAAELTAQLLAFARGGKYNVTPVSMNKVINDTINIIRSTFDKSITIEKHLTEDLPSIEGDIGQMQQVIMNICVNARDAMPAGGELSIETSVAHITKDYTDKHIDAKEGEYVVITISDTGLGMDKDTMHRIFEPFFTTKEKGKGTGLGLSMVYGIVKNHGGFIRVYSEPGAGTTFRVYLPASEKEVTEEQSEKRLVRGGSETILVVDDEEPIRNLACDILESAGYRVLTAEDGERAIEIFRQKKDIINLVILDMIMPKMNGGETFNELKKIKQDIKAILSSGYSQNGKAREIIESGVSGFLQKPYQVDKLLEKVREVLEG
ncbi:MAG: PAS domain S-box protein [Candidatus Kryptoniota bacterium]